MTDAAESWRGFVQAGAPFVARHDARSVARATQAANRATRIALTAAGAFLIVFVVCSLVWGGLWWIIGAAVALLFALWVLKPRSYAGALRAAAQGPDGLALSLGAEGIGVAEAPRIPWANVETVMVLDRRDRYEQDRAGVRVSGANPATAVTRLLFKKLDTYATVETGQAYLSLYVLAQDSAGELASQVPAEIRPRVIRRGQTLQFIAPLWFSIDSSTQERALSLVVAGAAAHGIPVTVLKSDLQLVKWAADQSKKYGDPRNLALTVPAPPTS